MNRPVFFMASILSKNSRSEKLSSPPPHGNSRENHNQRKNKLAADQHPPELSVCHRDSPVSRLLRTDRNQIFVGREPVNRVQAEVAIPVEAQEPVRRPL